MPNIYRSRVRFIGFLVACTVSLTARGETSVAVARQIGLGPEPLAAAGFTSNDALAMLDRLDEAASLRAALDVAAAELADAVAAVDAAIQSIHIAPTDVAAANDLAAAQSILVASKSAFATAVDNVWTEALDGIGESQRSLLENWQVAAPYALPPEFRVLARTEAEWRCVVIALRAEARALRRSEQVDESIAELLATIRAEQGVVQAAIDLDSELAMIEAVFASN
jgi:hypothetical protein